MISVTGSFDRFLDPNYILGSASQAEKTRGLSEEGDSAASAGDTQEVQKTQALASSTMVAPMMNTRSIDVVQTKAVLGSDQLVSTKGVETESVNSRSLTPVSDGESAAEPKAAAVAEPKAAAAAAAEPKAAAAAAEPKASEPEAPAAPTIQEATGLVAYEIELNDGVPFAKEYDYKVQILDVDKNILEGVEEKTGQTIKIDKVDYRLFHIHGETEKEISKSNFSVNRTDGTITDFSFTTTDFSTFVLVYTVEYHYTDNEAAITLDFTGFEPYSEENASRVFKYDTEECVVRATVEDVLKVAQTEGVAADSNAQNFEINFKAIKVKSAEGGVALAKDGSLVISADGTIVLTEGVKTLTVTVAFTKLKETLLEAAGVTIDVEQGKVPLGSKAQYTPNGQARTAELAEMVKNNLGEEEEEAAGYRSADLRIVLNDKEVPATGRFTVALEKSSLIPAGMKLEKLYHIHDGKVEELAVTENADGRLVFELTNFSDIVAGYTVDFVYRSAEGKICVNFENLQENSNELSHISIQKVTMLPVADILADAPVKTDDEQDCSEVYVVYLHDGTAKEEFDKEFFSQAAVSIEGKGVEYSEGAIRLTGDVKEGKVTLASGYKTLEVEISNYIAPTVVPEDAEAFTYRFFAVGETAAVADILAANEIVSSYYNIVSLSDTDLVTVDGDTLTAQEYFDSVTLTVALSDGTEVEIILSNPAPVKAGEIVATEGVGSFAATEDVPVGTKLAVDSNPKVPEGIVLPSNMRKGGPVESDPVFFEVSLVGPDGEPVKAGADVTLNTAIKLPEAPDEGQIVKVTGVKVYHIDENGDAEELEGATYALAEGKISSVSFTTPGFSLFAITYTVDFISAEVNKAWSWPGEGSYSVADIMTEIGVTGDIESVDLVRTDDQGGSDKALYLEEREDGHYLVSEEAFVDTFMLTVVVDDVSYHFTVTDESYDVSTNVSRVVISSTNADPYTVSLVSDTIQYNENEQKFAATFRVDYVVPANKIQTDGYKYEIVMGDVVFPSDYLNRTFIAKDGSETSFYYKFVKDGDTYKILIDYNPEYIQTRISTNTPIEDNFIQFNVLIERIKQSTETEEVIAVTQDLDIHIPDIIFDYPETEDKNHSINASKAFVRYTEDEDHKIHVFYTATVSSEKGTYEAIHMSDTLTTSNNNAHGYAYPDPGPKINSVTINSVIKKAANGGTQDVTSTAISNQVVQVNDNIVDLTYDLAGLSSGESYEVTYEYVYDKAFISNLNQTDYYVQYSGGNSLTVTTGEKPLTDHASGGYSIVKTNKPVEVNKWGEYKSGDGQIEWTITASFNNATYKGPYTVVDDAFRNIVSGSLEIKDKDGNTVTPSLSDNKLTFSMPGEYTIKYRTQAESPKAYQSTNVTNTATGSNDDQQHEKISEVSIPPTGSIDKTLESSEVQSTGSDGSGNYTVYTFKWHISIPVPNEGFPAGTVFKETLGAYIRKTGDARNHYLTVDQQTALHNAFIAAMPGASFNAGAYNDSDPNLKNTYTLTLQADWNPENPPASIELDYYSTGKLYTDDATIKTSSSSSGDSFTNTMSVDDVSSSATWEYTKLLQKKARVNGGLVDGSTVNSTVTRSGDRTLTWDIFVVWDGNYDSAQLVDSLPAGLRLKSVAFGGEYSAVELYRASPDSNTYQPVNQDQPGYDGLGNTGYSNWGNVYGQSTQTLGTDENNRVWPVATVTGDPASGQTVTLGLTLTGNRPHIFSKGSTAVMRVTAYVEDDQFKDFSADNESAFFTHTHDYTNTVSFSTNETPRGNESQTQHTTLKSEVLEKGETHSNFSSNHEIDYAIDINRDGHRLLPANSSSTTLTLEDELTYLKNTSFDFTVNLDLNSVKLYEKVNGSWVEYNDPSEPWVFTFEETSDQNNARKKIKKLKVEGIPDEKILQLRYTYRIDVTDAQTDVNYSIPEITNKAVLKGNGHVGSSETMESENINFSTSAGTISAKSLRIVKVDAQNNRTRLENAKFMLEKYTASGWQYVPAFVNPKTNRMRTGTWTDGGTTYVVYVTNNSGVLELSQPKTGSNSFEMNTAYRIREVEAPEGYQVSNPAPMAYFYFDTTSSGVSPIPNDANWSRADNLSLESDSMVINNTKIPELIITKTFAGEEITQQAKNNITFTVTGPNSYSRTIQLSAFTYNAATGVYTYKLNDAIVDAGVYTVTETNMDTDGVHRVSQYSVNSKPVQDTGSASTVTAENVKILFSTGHVVFKNIYGTTEITAHKVWDDQNDLSGARPSSITLQLKQDGENYGSPVTVTQSSVVNSVPWSYEWTGLPADHTYTVEETPVDGYVTNVVYTQNGSTAAALTADGSVAVTNTLTGIHVRKVWDPANQNEIGAVYVKLEYYDVDDSAWKTIQVNYSDTVSLDSSNGWKYSWQNLDATKTYRVTETGSNPDGRLSKFIASYQVNGGTSTDSAPDTVHNGDTVVITNTQKPGITVTKVWANDTANGNHTDEKYKVYVRLQRKAQNDAEAVWEDYEYDQLLFTSNNWTYTWESLDEGYDYRVREKSGNDYLAENGMLKIGGVVYKVSYTAQTAASAEAVAPGDTVTVTNTKNPGISVNKVWADGNENHSSASVAVKLQYWNTTYSQWQDISDNRSSITLNSGNNWAGEWDGLEDGLTYRVIESPEVDGFVITYAVKDSTNTAVARTNEQLTLGDTVTVTNTEKQSIKAVKSWVGTPLEKVYVKLQRKISSDANWSDVGSEAELTANTSPAWTYEWLHQDATDASGNAYTYRVVEYVKDQYNNPAPISGYVASFTVTDAQGDTVSRENAAETVVPGETVTITNTKNAGIEVQKVWVDDGTHPGPVWVCLRRRLATDSSSNWSFAVNNNAEQSTVELNSDNSWHYEWENLDATNENGVNWTYKVTEYPSNNVYNNADSISGYTVSYDVTNGHTADTIALGDTVTITNTVKPGITVVKRWIGSSATTIKVELQRKLSTATNSWDWSAQGEKHELNAGNNWTYTWPQLDSVDNNNVPYDYRVVEYDGNGNTLTGYTATYEIDGNGIDGEHIVPGDTVTITNTKVTTGVAVYKAWDLQENETIPNSVTVQLMRMGELEDPNAPVVTVVAKNQYNAESVFGTTSYKVVSGSTMRIDVGYNYKCIQSSSYSYTGPDDRIITISNITTSGTITVVVGAYEPSVTYERAVSYSKETGTSLIGNPEVLSSSNNWYKEWTDLDSNYHYYVVETKVDGVELDSTEYVPTYTNNDGIKTGTITITNRKIETPKGSVKVTKVFDGLTSDQFPADFQITNTVNNTVFGLNATGGKVAPTGGNGTRADPYYWQIDDLDVGTVVTFTETGLDVTGYNVSVTANGSVASESPFTATATAAQNTPGEASFENTYTPQPGSLTITKEIQGVASTDQIFTFEVTFTNADHSAYVGNVTVTDRTRTTATSVNTDNYGKLTVTITGAGSATITEIPAGTKYTVVETVPTGWEQSGTVAITGGNADQTIDSCETETATVTNTLTSISIQVTKQWTQGDSLKTTATSIGFELRQVLTPASGTPTPIDEKYTDYTNATAGITNGEGTVTYDTNNSLWNTVTISNLPLTVTKTTGEGATATTVTYNASYYVKETSAAADAGYVLAAETYKLNNGEPVSNANDAVATANGDKITIINTETAGVELPATGGPGTALYTVTGLTLTLGAALWLILRRKREQN